MENIDDVMKFLSTCSIGDLRRCFRVCMNRLTYLRLKACQPLEQRNLKAFNECKRMFENGVSDAEAK